MVTVCMGHVNSCEILAAFGDPIQQLLRMLLGQKRIDEDGIAFAINDRDCIRNPGEILLTWWDALGRAIALLGQKLPIQFRHTFSFLMISYSDTFALVL